MTYSVHVLARARADVDAIFQWIYERSPAGAASWYAAWLEAADSLATNPIRFARAAESDQFDYEVRERFFKTRRGRRYRIVFTIVESELRILRVRGPGQRPLQPDEL
jgi:plasmid stabilization system protein ParE